MKVRRKIAIVDVSHNWAREMHSRLFDGRSYVCAANSTIQHLTAKKHLQPILRVEKRETCIRILGSVVRLECYFLNSAKRCARQSKHCRGTYLLRMPQLTSGRRQSNNLNQCTRRDWRIWPMTDRTVSTLASFSTCTHSPSSNNKKSTLTSLKHSLPFSKLSTA